MDVAALSLQIDSSDVVKAANDLDRFASASDRAKSAAGGQSGSISRMVQDYGRAAEKAGQFSNAASRAAEAAQRSASAASAGSSSLVRLGDGYDILTGKLNSNLASINRNIAGWERQGKAVNDNAGQIRASTSNIAANIQDVGVTAAMGMNPMLIALQQGTQLSAALADGGLKSLGAALRSVLSPTSLLTIAVVAGAAALIQWGMSALKSSNDADKLSDALKKTQVTTYALGDAQTALSNVFDLTTGKIKTQSAALVGLARAQLEVIRAQALADRAESQKVLKDIRGTNRVAVDTGISTRNPYAPGSTAFRYEPDVTQKSIDAISKGVNTTRAIDQLERLRKAGKITEDQFIKLTAATANLGMAGENLKVYEDARKALEGDKGALKQFLDLPKAPNRGKSDAEKLVDIFSSARADIAAEKARALAEANQLGAFEAARLEKQTALLNAVQQKGIPITDAVRTKVGALAEEYAKFKVAADVSVAINGVTNDIQKQRDAIADRTKLIGLYGDALSRATRELDAQRKLRESLPRDEVVVIPNLTGKLSDDIETAERAQRLADIKKASEDATYVMDLERQSLDLSGAALIAFNYAMDQKIRLQRQNGVVTAEEIAKIDAAADAYGRQRYAIDETARAIADSREVAKGFFSDWINGVREGGNIFRTFADSVVNSLNRIIDKLLDRTLDGFLDSLFSGGGLLGGLFGGGSSRALVDDGSMKAELDKIFSNLPIRLPGFALGGTFDRAQRFANGEAFTNTIVNTPTLFRFANGAALGEMGEAGPEAIMPLTRGPDGKLGVQSHGGGSRNAEVNVTNHYQFAGAVGLDAIIAMIRQGGEATYNQVKRDLETMLQQSDADGAVAT